MRDHEMRIENCAWSEGEMEKRRISAAPQLRGLRSLALLPITEDSSSAGIHRCWATTRRKVSKREERCGWVVGLDMEKWRRVWGFRFWKRGGIRFIQRKAPDFTGTWSDLMISLKRIIWHTLILVLVQSKMTRSTPPCFSTHSLWKMREILVSGLLCVHL